MDKKIVVPNIEEILAQYCKSLVEVYSRDNNWTIIFGAANIDAYHTGAQYGISAENAFNVEADAPTVTIMMRAVSEAVHTSSTPLWSS